MHKLTKIIALLLAVCMLAGMAIAESGTQNGNMQPPQGENGNPPEKPEGDPPQMPEGQQPPEMPKGEMPQGMGDGQTPPEMPEGQQPQGMGGDMGGTQKPESYQAILNVDDNDMIYSTSIDSVGTDENAILVTAGEHEITDGKITRKSSDSTGGDSASFYGVGAAVLVTGGNLTLDNYTIETDAAGGAGAFAYDSGNLTLNNCAIHTLQDTSGGIHVAGGGRLIANSCTVTTEGNSSAAIRSDRGGGMMTVTGGSYTASGSGSPAVYCTADIDIADAALTATASEALCLEGKNSVSLTNCSLSGNMPDDARNDTTWTVILYQSMSGDAEEGKGTFTMTGGSLTSGNGGLFYTTNTESEFALRNVTITAAEDCEYFLRCTGNANQRGWGTAGANGARCTFVAAEQDVKGDIICDSISELSMTLAEGSVFTGAVIDDESCAGAGGEGGCDLIIDKTSCWEVSADSTLRSLSNAGTIVDIYGDSVTIRSADGSLIRLGDSCYTITVAEYESYSE